MDLKQLEYIVEISKTNNISQAAKNLFVSQSALNQQLLKLEKDLGCQLFYRSRTNWHPTPVGEIYIEGAKKILLIKKDTYSRINDIMHDRESELRLGLVPRRGIQMFTSIYPRLHKSFSNIKLTPLEMSVAEQQEAIRNGDIDLGFMTLSRDQMTDDIYEFVGREELVLFCPAIHPLCEKISEEYELPVIDIREFRYEPFAVMYQGSTIRPICDRIFAEAGFDPDILIETSTTSSIPALVASNLCLGIAPRYYLDPKDTRIRAFALKGHPTWDLCISYRRKSYLSDAASEYIRLAGEYWKQVLPPVQKN